MTYRVTCYGTNFGQVGDKEPRRCASLAAACLLAAETAAARRCRGEFAILPGNKVAAADEVCRIWWSADLQVVRSMVPVELSIVELIVTGVVAAVNRETQMEMKRQSFGIAEA